MGIIRRIKCVYIHTSIGKCNKGFKIKNGIKVEPEVDH